MEMKDRPIQFFLDELASKQPTPGGGSVAALMGAQAAALVSMVCNLTLGKPKFAAVENEMQALLAEAEALRADLTGMIKADMDVFNAVMSCYGLPKNTDEEKKHRAEQIQIIFRQATLVPLECAKACARTVQLSRIAAEKGNPGLISDAGAAAMAGYAGLKSAALNVHVNAASLKDREFADARLAELKALIDGVDLEAQAIYRLAQAGCE